MVDAFKQNDTDIPVDAVLWRLIHKDWVHFDPNPSQERYRPSSNSYNDNRNGNVSVSIADEVLEMGLSPYNFLLKVRDNFPNSGIASISASLVREIGLTIKRTPSDLIPAHAELVGKKTGKRKSELAKASVWVIAPPGYESKIKIS